MIEEHFWLYVVAFWISGAVFTFTMERREGFQKRIWICSLFAFVTGIVIWFLPGGNGLLKEAVWQATCCALLCTFLHFCWDISWSVACYNMVWGVSVWQVTAEGITVIMLLQRMVAPNVFLERIGIIVVYTAAYLFCGNTIAKWMPMGRKERLGPRQMGLTLLLFAAISMLSFHEKVGNVDIMPYQWGYFYLTQMICVVILYLEGELFKKSQLQQEMEMLNLMYLTQQEQYRISKENIALINQKCHDLKHQIRALRNADKDELDKYLGEIENSVQIYEAIVKTGNDVFDTILTEKSLLCKDRQIQVSCVADASQLGFIDTIDLYAILGNVMDNAIEAVEKIKEKEKRQIDVLIYRQHNFVVVNIINPIEGHLHYEDGLPVTTKRDKKIHGFGLQSVRQILKKYEGFLNVREEDGCFSLKMLIPIQLKVTT